MRCGLEQVRDLLNPSRMRPAAGKGGDSGGSGDSGGGALRVREHPRTGPYVDYLAKIACMSSQQVRTLLEHGDALRTVRATKLPGLS